MATFSALTYNGGSSVRQIHSPDILSTGGGITSDAGNLVLSAFGTDVKIGANKNLSGTAGTGAVDFSAMTGAFKTSTGAVTIGPGAVTVSGAASFTAAGTGLAVINNATIGGTLAVTGLATVGGSLGVTGLLTAAGNVTTPQLDNASGTLVIAPSSGVLTIGKVGATASFLGNVSIAGTETVVGASTFTGAEAFNGLVTFGAGLVASSAVAIDFSGSTGAFKTSTGAVTLGPGAVSITGDVTATGNLTMTGTGKTLSFTGTANINLPTGFQINGTAVAAGVTAANLGTLTAGSASSADALHTHPALSATSPTLTGFDTTAFTTSGFCAYQTSAAGQISAKTDATALATSIFLGFYEGVAGSLQVGGQVADAAFTTAGGTPANGAIVYLAAAGEEASAAGKLTASAYSIGTAVGGFTPAANNVCAPMGICVNNTNYAGAKTCKVLVRDLPLIVL